MSNSSICRSFGASLVAALMVACGPAEIEAADNNDNGTVLSTEIGQASYRLGYDQAAGLLEQTGGVLDLAAFARGVSDAAGGEDAAVPESERARLMQALQAAVAAVQSAAQSEANAQSQAFRDEFAARAGVTQTESGLLYEVIVEGSGPKPALTDTVTTHYHGTLTSGEVFDSSVDRGSPASFPVNGVIKGWTEALQMMGVGSKWRLVIPPELGYGERGAGGLIGPNETLVFEVELLEIQ